MERLIAYVPGQVQKTGYRSRVVKIANSFGIAGYVQNLPDGRVKVVAEGERPDLEAFRKAILIRNTIIYVTEIEQEYSSPHGEFDGFVKVVSTGETDQRLDRAAELLTELIVINKEIAGEVRGLREDVQGVREEVKAVHDEVKATRVELRDEIRASGNGIREEIEGVRKDIQESRDYIVGETTEVRSIRRGRR